MIINQLKWIVESIEILKVLGLINNIKVLEKIYSCLGKI